MTAEEDDTKAPPNVVRMRLRRFLEQRELSVGKLARLAGLSHTYIQHFLKGATRTLGRRAAEKLAVALGIGLTDLIGAETGVEVPIAKLIGIKSQTKELPLQDQASAVDKPTTVVLRVTLDEGELLLSYPANLSTESYQDVIEHIEVKLRSLKRRPTTGNDGT